LRAGSPARRFRLASSLLVPLSFLTIYFFLASPRLSLPGLFVDEVVTVSPLWEEALSVKWGAWSFPVSLMGYHGALESYVFAPFAALLGNTPEALRVCAGLFGGAALLAVYGFCLVLFRNRWIAWGSAFFLGTLSSYVTGSRLGMYHGIIPLFFQMAALYFFVRWFRILERRSLYAAFLLQGAAVGCRIWFLFGLVAAACAGLALCRRSRFRRLASLGFSRAARTGAMCFFLFAVGAFPLTLHVGIRGGEFLSRFRARYSQQGPALSEYAHYLKVHVVHQLPRLWGDDDFLNEIFPPASGASVKWGTCLAAGLGIFWFACLAFLRRGAIHWRKRAFVLSFPLVWILLVPFSGPRPNHLFAVIPFLAIVFVASAEEVWRLAGRRWGRRPVAVGFVATLALVRLGDWPLLPSRLAAMDGVSPYFGDAIYPLADWLRHETPNETVAADFRMVLPLRYLLWDGFRLSEKEPSRSGEEPILLMLYGAPPPAPPLEIERHATFAREFRGRGGHSRIGVYRLRDASAWNGQAEDPGTPTAVPFFRGTVERKDPGFVPSAVSKIL
jgi:hypothetical protein